MSTNRNFTVSDYLFARLKSLNVDHVFGIPGDFILPFFEMMVDSEVEHVAACNELNAGYAADGYARLRGLSAVAATYGPGSFSLVNAVAGAYAESVPMLVISGAPKTEAFNASPRPILHHLMGTNYEANVRIFEQVTTHAKTITNAAEATAEIDKALEICLAEQKPVFLEIPSDIQIAPCEKPQPREFALGRNSEAAALSSVLEQLTQRVADGKRTVILPGHELHRYNLQEKVTELVNKTELPIGTMFIGKADFIEQSPHCIGLYQGAGSHADVKEYVDTADTVIFLGSVPSDFNLGGFTSGLTEDQCVHVYENEVRMNGKSFENIAISDIVDGLLESLPANCGKDDNKPVHGFSHKTITPYEADPSAKMTNKRFYDRMAHFIQPTDVIMADAGCAINSSHLQLPERTSMISSCYWASIGMGFGATLGACFAADDNQRIIAMEGDGSFQMTAQELGTMTRYGKSPIIFIVNNSGYTAERLIHDGPFNDIANWKYHKLPEAFGGKGIDVHTEMELEEALQEAANYSDIGPLVIEVHVDPFDASEAFILMSETLRKKD